MVRAVLLGFIFINYLSTARAEGLPTEAPQNNVPKLALKWVTARIGQCANLQLAAALVVEKNSDAMTALITTPDCVADNALCLKSVDISLKEFFRMNYKRFSVRCSLSKVEINNNYLQIYGESVFGTGSSQAHQVEDQDFPTAATLPVEKTATHAPEKNVREIASEKKQKR